MQRITLCGREYSLRFSVNSLCCLEEKMDKGLAALLKTDLSSLRALLWCGLLEQEQHLTLEDAGFFPHPEKKREKDGCAAAI